MFRRFFKAIFQPWVLIMLLLIGVALLIWFAGPLIAIADVKILASPTVRLLVIMSLFFVWGANNLRLRLRDRKQSRQFAKDMEKEAEPAPKSNKADSPQLQAEHAILADRLKGAMATLQRAKPGKGRKLYQLPWYVIIGAPGSGKTTAIRHSGLHFPLESELGENPVHGAGGTRYCDWWFTNEAVFIDTAGRYTTQDNPKQIESSAWQHFLRQLRKSRPKRPLNGVVVSVSVQDLINRTPTQQAIQARAIKQRIQELNQQLCMDLPVYVLLTKTDLIAGFNEFFADLDQTQRAQPWGVAFEHRRAAETGQALDQFPSRFEAMVARCGDRVLRRLHDERDLPRRQLCFEFPRQMLGMKDTLHRFLREVFVPNQFEPPSRLRGVFFVSGTQEAGQAQWVSGAVPDSWSLPPVSAAATGDRKSFFLKSLLHDVIFPEAGMAEASDYARRRYRWQLGTGLAASLLTFALGLGMWWQSYGDNRAYLQEVQKDLTTYRSVTGGGLSTRTRDWTLLAAGLKTLRELPTGYEQREQPMPWRMGFGLYQGDKIGAQSRTTYREALERFYMPMLAYALAEQIDLAGANEDYLYEALRFYLMLYHPDHMAREPFTLWVEVVLSRLVPGDAQAPLRAELIGHLNAALDQGVLPPPVDSERVAYARDILIRTPLERRIYRRLKNEFLQQDNSEISVASELGKRAEVVFYRRSGEPLDRGVPRFFSYNHFHTGFTVQNRKLAERLSHERWIYGDAVPAEFSEEETAAIRERVQEIYFEEYVAHWRAYLQDLAVKPFHSAGDGRVVLNMLASQKAPLTEWLKAVRKHTALSEPPESAKAAGDVADAVTDATMRHEKDRLQRLVPKSASGPKVTLPGEAVSVAFYELNEYVTDESGLPLGRLQTALKSMSGYMDRLAYSNDLKQAAFEANSGGDKGGAITELKRALSEAPPVVQAWFGQLPRQVARVTNAATHGHVNDVWRSEVFQFYEKAIAGKYPVDPEAREEIRLEDFQRFFGPGGLMDSYFQRNLSPFVDRSGPRWRWRERVGIPDDALALFERAHRIREAYFQGDKPGVAFVLKPYSLDATVARSLIETAGQKVDYQHGPVRASMLSWPGEVGDNSRVVFNLVSRGTPVSTREDGEWSWFRLLDRHAEMAAMDGGNSLLLTFRLQGVQAQYELRPRSIHHPFGNNELANFELPRRL